jgi:hypothetical protein
MYSIRLFVEDNGHEVFLNALIQRFAVVYSVSIDVRFGNAEGGYGKMMSELKEFIKDFLADQEEVPDLLIAATDSNCKGLAARKQQIDHALKGYNRNVIYAIPEPHIEKWLLLDSVAFKTVLGKGCPTPPQKCERDFYKRLLRDAVRATGVNPPLGGIEYGEDIVNAMDLDKLERTEASLGHLLKALRQQFQIWQHQS